MASLTFKAYMTAVAILMVAGMVILSTGIAAGQSISWARLFGTSFTDQALAAAVDRSGNLSVSGTTKGKFPGQSRSGGVTDAFLSKFDGDGEELALSLPELVNETLRYLSRERINEWMDESLEESVAAVREYLRCA